MPLRFTSVQKLTSNEPIETQKLTSKKKLTCIKEENKLFNVFGHCSNGHLKGKNKQTSEPERYRKQQSDWLRFFVLEIRG